MNPAYFVSCVRHGKEYVDARVSIEEARQLIDDHLLDTGCTYTLEPLGNQTRVHIVYNPEIDHIEATLGRERVICTPDTIPPNATSIAIVPRDGPRTSPPHPIYERLRSEWYVEYGYVHPYKLRFYPLNWPAWTEPVVQRVKRWTRETRAMSDEIRVEVDLETAQRFVGSLHFYDGIHVIEAHSRDDDVYIKLTRVPDIELLSLISNDEVVDARAFMMEGVERLPENIEIHFTRSNCPEVTPLWGRIYAHYTLEWHEHTVWCTRIGPGIDWTSETEDV